MINKDLQAWGRRIANMVVAPLASSGITPNLLTLIGLLLSFLTAAVIATGQFTLGGVMLLCAGIFDMFDGALARVTGKSTDFGAFFDSTLDRIAEAGVGLGLLWVYTARGATVATTVLYAAMIGSLMISYARARAESLNIECKVGLMARPERVIILSIGLLLGPTATFWALVVLAVSTWTTVVQRIYHVWRETEGRASSVEPPVPHHRPSPFRRKRIAS